MTIRFSFNAYIKVQPRLLKGWNCALKMFIILACRMQHERLKKFLPVNILSESLIPAENVKNLGVWFDSKISGTKHAYRLCYIQMRDLRQIWQYLPCHTTLTVPNALIGRRLDYCNSLLRGLPAIDLRKLQCVQNCLARIICNANATPMRKALH